MVTGISRFTKGEFNQDALDEVYNKGKELYKDPVPPPSSGIIYMNTDEIWDEYKGDHDHLPLAAKMDLGQMKDPSMGSCGPKGFSHSANFDTWHLFTPWNEIEVASSATGCQPSRSDSLSTSENTAVMLGDSYCYMKYDGVWKLKQKKPFYKVQFQEGKIRRSGCIADSEEIDYHDYHWFGSHNEAIFNMNSWGNWWHPFPGDSGGAIYKDKDANGNWRDPDAIAHLYYAKLTLIDTGPDGIDDRHLAEFIIHTSGDKYIQENPDGTTENRAPESSTCYTDKVPPPPLHCNDWDLGISKYKTVTNDWQLFSALSPNIELRYPDYTDSDLIHWITKADFDFYFADLPLPTTPY